MKASYVRLPSEETFDYGMTRFHKGTRLKLNERALDYAVRIRRETKYAQAAHFAYGQDAENYGYAVNKNDALLMLNEPHISRRIYNALYSDFESDPRFNALFPVPLTTSNPNAIKQVDGASIDAFSLACDTKGLTAQAPPAPQQKKEKNSSRGSTSSDSSVNQVQAFAGMTEDSRGRQRKRGSCKDRADRSRSRSLEVYTKAAERLASNMKTATTMADKDKVLKGFHSDVPIACEPEADQ